MSYFTDCIHMKDASVEEAALVKQTLEGIVSTDFEDGLHGLCGLVLDGNRVGDYCQESCGLCASIF